MELGEVPEGNIFSGWQVVGMGTAQPVHLQQCRHLAVAA